MRTTITAVAKYLPERVLTNSDLEKMVNTSDEWILSRTGISERHIVSDGEATSDMCTRVAEQILEKRGISSKELDVIIVGTVTPDMLLPSTAALIQNQISATNAWGFDLSAACSGFLFALESGSKLVESGKYQKVLVMGADTMSSIIDYEDRETCILFGDGAGGVLLEPSSNDSGILDSLLYTDGGGGNFLKMPAGGSQHPASHDTVNKRLHYITQEGREVFRSAIRGMADATSELLKLNKLRIEDIRLFIPHQANKRIIDSYTKRLGLTPEQVMINIEHCANTTGGTIPIALAEAVETNRISTGDYVVLAAFGAGYTWGSILIRWDNCT